MNDECRWPVVSRFFVDPVAEVSHADDGMGDHDSLQANRHCLKDLMRRVTRAVVPELRPRKRIPRDILKHRMKTASKDRKILRANSHLKECRQDTFNRLRPVELSIVWRGKDVCTERHGRRAVYNQEKSRHLSAFVYTATDRHHECSNFKE